MVTGGLAGLGSFYDLVTLPIQVREANLREEYRRVIWGREPASSGFPEGESVKRESRDSMERVILKVARKNNGIVTPAEVALEGGFDLDRVKETLEKLVSRGYAEIRVKKSGTYVYFFSDFSKGHNPDLEDF